MNIHVRRVTTSQMNTDVTEKAETNEVSKRNLSELSGPTGRRHSSEEKQIARRSD